MKFPHSVIQVLPNGIQLTDYRNENDFDLSEYNFTQTSEIQKKEELADFLKSKQVSDNLYLVCSGLRNCLVPVSIYNESKPQDIFQFTFGESSKELDFCRIPDISIVNLYEIPLWIKSFFVVRFPTLVMMHESTAILKILSNCGGLNTRIALNVQTNYFGLSIYHLGNVVFQNSFELLENADMIYHTLHALKQHQLNNRRANLFLFAGDSKSKNKLHELLQDFKKINDFSQLQIEIKENFIAQNIKLCE